MGHYTVAIAKYRRSFSIEERDSSIDWSDLKRTVFSMTLNLSVNAEYARGR
jgi:hypothetical protein